MKRSSPHKPLTPEEEAVIVHRGTERPHSGRYDDYFALGTYVCKRCQAPLYRSQDKFASRCGWPSFDDDIPGAVKRHPDADGKRIEIVCAACGAHLGHVFVGEGFTPKDTRHCVNSISLDFIPKPDSTPQRAVFAAGCFWGVQYYLQRAPGVLRTSVGYTGGQVANPTYEEVCSHETGHVEAVEVEFDPGRTSYEALAKLFFEIHDFTQENGQGPDLGEQYRSVIFYQDEEQKKTAEALIAQLTKKGHRVATRLEKASPFWKAEEYHQGYYDARGGTPYCHRPSKVFD